MNSEANDNKSKQKRKKKRFICCARWFLVPLSIDGMAIVISCDIDAIEK